MITPKCDCGVEYTYRMRIMKDLQYYVYYQCPKCGQPTHYIDYAFIPTNCPGHRFEHLGHEFRDGVLSHTIEQLDRCYLCGLVRKLPKDTKGAGFSGRVEIDHPQVTLLWNRSAWERKIPLELKELATSKPPEQAILPAEGSG